MKEIIFIFWLHIMNNLMYLFTEHIIYVASHMNIGTIVGIVLAVVALLSVIAIVVVFVR